MPNRVPLSTLADASQTSLPSQWGLPGSPTSTVSADEAEPDLRYVHVHKESKWVSYLEEEKEYGGPGKDLGVVTKDGKEVFVSLALLAAMSPMIKSAFLNVSPGSKDPDRIITEMTKSELDSVLRFLMCGVFSADLDPSLVQNCQSLGIQVFESGIERLLMDSSSVVERCSNDQTSANEVNENYSKVQSTQNVRIPLIDLQPNTPKSEDIDDADLFREFLMQEAEKTPKKKRKLDVKQLLTDWSDHEERSTDAHNESKRFKVDGFRASSMMEADWSDTDEEMMIEPGDEPRISPITDAILNENEEWGMPCYKREKPSKRRRSKRTYNFKKKTKASEKQTCSPCTTIPSENAAQSSKKQSKPSEKCSGSFNPSDIPGSEFCSPLFPEGCPWCRRYFTRRTFPHHRDHEQCSREVNGINMVKELPKLDLKEHPKVQPKLFKLGSKPIIRSEMDHGELYKSDEKKNKTQRKAKIN